MIAVPDAWREANTHLRQAVLAEAAARQLAAMQDGDGARRELTLAALHALRAAARLGKAAATVDGSVGKVEGPPGITGQKERTR